MHACMLTEMADEALSTPAISDTAPSTDGAHPCMRTAPAPRPRIARPLAIGSARRAACAPTGTMSPPRATLPRPLPHTRPAATPSEPRLAGVAAATHVTGNARAVQ